MNHPHYQPKSSQPLPDLTLQDASWHLAAEQALYEGNRHYNRYLARSSKKDLIQAVNAFQHALDLDPTLTEAQVKLASALYEQGKISVTEAIFHCENAVQLKPTCAESALFLGYFLRRAGRLEQAQVVFQKSLSLRESPKARMALGSVIIQQASKNRKASPSLRLGQTLHGLLHFTRGLCGVPFDRATFQTAQLALTLDAQIYTITSLGRLLQFCRLTPLTAKLYEQASRALPEEPIFFHLLGDIQMEKNNPDAAIYFYNRSHELDPDDLLLQKKLGQSYNRCDDPANASKMLEKLVEADVRDTDTLYTLAQIYTDNQEYIRALYYYKELLAEDFENPYLHSHIGYILFKLEDYEGAVEAYQTAVKLGKDPVWTSTVAQTLGTIYYQIQQDHDSAAQLFRLATGLDPSNMDAWAMLGDLCTEQNNYEEAIRIYRHILKAQPDNPDCYNYLGYLLWQLDKNDEAIQAYQQAIQLNLDNPIAFNNLGVIYLDEKCQLQKALEMFEQALTLKPDYTLACFNIGRVREALGDTTEAAQFYSQALTLNKQSPELSDDEILERLEQLFRV